MNDDFEEARHQARMSAIQDIADDVRKIKSDVDAAKDQVNEVSVGIEEAKVEASARAFFVRWELIRRNRLYVALVAILVLMNAWQWREQAIRDDRAQQDRARSQIITERSEKTIERVEDCLTPGKKCFEDLKAEITGKPRNG